MVDEESKSSCPQGSNWCRTIGLSDFCTAWRIAFRVDLVLLTSAGVVVSCTWMWILSSLWKMGGSTFTPPSFLDLCIGRSVCSFFAVQSLSQHWVYWLCLLVPFVFLWALLGGAAQRLIAMEYSGDQDATVGRALDFAAGKYWNGFFPAWMLPVAFFLLVAVILFVYGMFVAIPWVGDLIGGAFFFVALALGCLLTFGLLVVAVGGNLFAPAVAVGGAHGADAATHGVAFVLNKPFRAGGYLLLTGLMVWVTAVVLMGAVEFAQTVTLKLVAAGEGVWSTRTGASASDNTSQFFFDCWSRGLRCLAFGVVANVFFAASVVSFVLLRESVDGTDRREMDPADRVPSIDGPSEEGGKESTDQAAS